MKICRCCGNRVYDCCKSLLYTYRTSQNSGKQELLHENRQDPYLRTHPISRDRISDIMEATKNIKIISQKT